MAISINKVDAETKNKIIEAYKNNMSLREIEKEFKVLRATVSKFLEEQNIKKIKGNHYRKYFHDFDFFENIDTEEKAYWLGFMFADGYIVNHENRYGEDSFGLTLAEDSLDSIEKFKKSLHATNPILYDNSKSIGQPQAKIVLTSQKTVNDLIDKGCVKQKSLILQPPKKVSEKLPVHVFEDSLCSEKAKTLPSLFPFTALYELLSDGSASTRISTFFTICFGITIEYVSTLFVFPVRSLSVILQTPSVNP